MQSQKNIAVLGATGSIGSQTLDIIAAHPERYRATVLTAGTRVDRLVELARRFRPRLAVIAREELYGELRRGLQGCGVECAAGAEALAACVEAPDIDTVLTATVGYSGLAPTIRAIRAGRDIALANKETLVVAGELITGLLASSSSRVFRLGAFSHSAMPPRRGSGDCPTTDYHRLRRAFPHMDSRADAHSPCSRRPESSELVDGRKNNRRFSDHDEQGF